MSEKADKINSISFTGYSGDLKIVTRVMLYTIGSDYMAQIERKPYKSRNPKTGNVEVTTYKVLTEKAYLHKKLINEVFHNPCKWD